MGGQVVRTIVALGSNLGDRERNIVAAIECLSAIAEGEIRCSSLHHSIPEGMPGEPDFINAVVAFETDLEPFALLHELQDIEVRLGRPRDHGENESRTIDLDIIWYGDLTIDEADLKIPHPRASSRDFVMLPLEEVAPDISLT